MNQLLVEPAPSNVQRVRPIAGRIGIVLAVVAVLVISMWLVRPPDFVDHVSVTNRSGYDLNVDVSDVNRDGWLPISVATGGGATTRTQDVIDQDDTWIFRFSYAGKNAGELSVPRSELADNGWRVAVPESVAQNLRDAGIQPGP
jgi:hypothetical protein